MRRKIFRGFWIGNFSCPVIIIVICGPISLYSVDHTKVHLQSGVKVISEVKLFGLVEDVA